MKVKFERLIIVLFIASLVKGVSAQNNLSIGLNYGLVNSNKVITDYGSEIYKEFRTNNETSSCGMEYGIDFLYNIKNNWFLESGVSFIQRGYETVEDNLIDPCYSPTTCGFKSEIYRYNYNFIEVPIQIVYETSNKLNISFKFGTSILVPMSNKVDWVLRTQYGKSMNQKIIAEKNEGPTNFNLTLNFGLGIGYRISERINLKISPKFDYNIFAHENKDIIDRLYNIGKFVNEDKSTAEHLISHGVALNIIYNLRIAATNKP